MYQLQCTCRRKPAADILQLDRLFAASLREFSHSASQLADSRDGNAKPQSATRAPRPDRMANMARTIQAASGSSTTIRRPPPGQILKAPAKMLNRPANLRLSKPGQGGGQRGDQGKVAVNKFVAGAIQANRKGQGPRGRGPNRSPRRFEEADPEAAAAEAATFKEAFQKMIDPSPKQETKAYEPVDITIESLRNDWPSFPTNHMSQLESIEEQLRWLARRFPHGHEPDHELAKRVIKGELVSFESADEKQRILSLVSEMQVEIAERKIEETGEEHPVKPIEFEGMTDQSKTLADVYIRGVYPELQKQRVPLLDQVVTQLRNNQTYGLAKSDVFVKKIESLIPQQQQQQQQQSRKQKSKA